MRRVFDEWEEDRASDPSNPAAAVAHAELAFVRAAAEMIFTKTTIARVDAAYEAARHNEARREAARREGISIYNPHRGLTTAFLAGRDTMILPLGQVIHLRRRSDGEQGRTALRVERAADALSCVVSRRARREPTWALIKRNEVKANNGALLADMKRLTATKDARDAISRMLGALTRGAKKAQPAPQRRAA